MPVWTRFCVAVFAVASLVLSSAVRPAAAQAVVEVETYYTYNSTNNRVQSVRVVGSDGSERVTVYTYAFEQYSDMGVSGTHEVYAPYSVTIKDGWSGTVLSKTWTTWSNQTASGRWKPKVEWRWTGQGDPSGAPSTSIAAKEKEYLAYNAYGQTTRFREAGQHDTYLSYDNRSRLTRIARGALEMNVAYANNTVRWIRDENNVTTCYSYDRLLRLTHVHLDVDGYAQQSACSAPDYLLTEYRYHYHTGSDAQVWRDPSYVQTVLPGGSKSPTVFMTDFADGLGRSMSTRTGPTQGRAAVTRIDYGANGKPVRTWRPVFSQ